MITKQYETVRLKTFTVVKDCSTHGATIGRIIPHNYGYDAIAWPSGDDLACWETEEKAVQAIISEANK
jgi:hypothetical protein